MGTNFDYDDTSHQVIFDHINGGSGSGALQQVSQEWQKLGHEIGSTGKSFVESVISNIIANRDGAAAQAAVAATGAMLPWMDDVAQIAATTALRTQEQADYWVRAKNSVPPVPPAPQSTGFFSDPGEWTAEKMDWFPGVTSEEEKAQQRQQEAAEQARQAMRVYQASSNPNVDAAPAFTAPQALDSSVGSLPLSGSTVGVSAPAPTVGGGAPAHLMAAHQPATHQSVTPQPVARQSATNRPAATVSQLAPGAPGSSVAPSNGWPGSSTPSQGLPPGTLAASAGLGAAVSAVPPNRTGTRAGGAGGGGGARHAEFSQRPSAEFGPRPTAGPHPSPEEMSGARGGAAGAGRNAGGAGYGQPFAAGAGQRGEPDGEHRSKYLLHDDSNTIVGDLPPTAPPVIGADY
ncbi:MAG: PPE domain-containing protein [Pseudonocardiaceae bacterium]